MTKTMKTLIFGLVTAILLATIITVVSVHMSQAASTGGPNDTPAQPMEAVSVINIGTAQSGITGLLIFTQQNPNSPVMIKGDIKGLPPNSFHGFHIHESGDTRNAEKPCNSAGGHYNPEIRDHAGPEDAMRHIGDLGNIEADGNGVANIDISDSKVSLTGPYSIVGRTVVVHELKDDLGKGEGAALADSKKTGNAGARIGCGLIGTIYKKP